MEVSWPRSSEVFQSEVAIFVAVNFYSIPDNHEAGR